MQRRTYAHGKAFGVGILAALLLGAALAVAPVPALADEAPVDGDDDQAVVADGQEGDVPGDEDDGLLPAPDGDEDGDGDVSGDTEDGDTEDGETPGDEEDGDADEDADANDGAGGTSGDGADSGNVTSGLALTAGETGADGVNPAEATGDGSAATHATAGWYREGGSYYWYDAGATTARTGWLVAATSISGTSTGLQRYWLGEGGVLAMDRLIDESEAGWWAYATTLGYVVRGRYTASSGCVYLANNDGRLESPGWHVTNRYGQGLQRYYVDAEKHACVPGYSGDGYAHYTTSAGYVLRGAATVDGSKLLADNDGRLAVSRWVVTNKFGQGLQRYWAGSDGAFAVSRLVSPSEGAGYWAYATSAGYVLRGKASAGSGLLYVADNDGRLVGGDGTGAEGWIVTGAYDGGRLQRYWVVPSAHAVRTGAFEVSGSHYYGRPALGYVLRGKLRVGNGMLLADNDGKLAWREGWLVTGTYDGGTLQRYRIDGAPGSGLMGAHLGLFTLGGSQYLGLYDKGYVLRGYYLDTSAKKVYYGNNDGKLGKGWLSTVGEQAWIRFNNYSSSTKYMLVLNCDECHLIVFEGSAGNWTPIYDWLAGTGLPQYNNGQGTTRGLYTLGGNGACYNWAERNNPGYVKGGAKCYYYAKDDIYYFYGWNLDLGFHSTIPSQGSASSQIGRKVSHGCVRLLIQNAKWIYDNCPYGTRVISYPFM